MIALATLAFTLLAIYIIVGLWRILVALEYIGTVVDSLQRTEFIEPCAPDSMTASQSEQNFTLETKEPPDVKNV